MNNDIYDRTYYRIWNLVYIQGRSWEKVSDDLFGQVRGQLCDSVWYIVESQLYKRANHSLWSGVRDLIRHQIGDNLIINQITEER